ncbi:unnamed protein product [Prorocentrum cordatum]|uniref:Uncharacterized protein n=1 Tax=Prorocentrum cordatum TaxID=2364126 RepID=A0ABN9UHI8_9DINO|nr:unnamed protein product [Polarella glacialis]
MHRVEAGFSAGGTSRPTSPRPASPRPASPRPASPRPFVDEAVVPCCPGARTASRPRSPSTGTSDGGGSTRAPDSPESCPADRLAPAFPLRAGPGAATALRHDLRERLTV